MTSFPQYPHLRNTVIPARPSFQQHRHCAKITTSFLQRCHSRRIATPTESPLPQQPHRASTPSFPPIPPTVIPAGTYPPSFPPIPPTVIPVKAGIQPPACQGRILPYPPPGIALVRPCRHGLFPISCKWFAVLSHFSWIPAFAGRHVRCGGTDIAVGLTMSSDYRCRINDVLAGTMLLRVHSTFVRGLSGYAFAG